MIRLTIPPGVHKDRLRRLLAQKFVLCGRVFVALRPKESKGGKAWKVYLIEVNENVDRYPKLSEGDHRRLTLREFVRWHNPIELNAKQVRDVTFMTFIRLRRSLQPISKWITRFDLGLSPSIPAVEFDPRNIEFVHDTCTIPCPTPEHIRTEVIQILLRSGERIFDPAMENLLPMDVGS